MLKRVLDTCVLLTHWKQRKAAQVGELTLADVDAGLGS